MSRVEDTLTELQIASPPSFSQDGLDPSDESTDSPRPETFDNLPPELVGALQAAFGTLATTLPSDSVLGLIQSILSRVSNHATLDP